jgi:acyl-coenzyme A thioesterase PaaI-like protein
MRAHDGVSHWLELHPKPAPGETVKKTISLIKFGHGLGGYAGICHGGAILTLMDEALAYPLVVREWQTVDAQLAAQHKATWESLRQGKPLLEVLKGMYVTAKLDIKFLSPVLAPGIIGIETEVLEMTNSKMKVRGIMKDAKGTPLMHAEGLWVKIRGAAKL